ncbi:TldD/PmbA family protein [Micromonospora sp. NPDC049559]|uniref:TldD/PmbA family protein n=1 Tax=Micromonospora sp. NPDC049559 TaxID=3155923 RepID=UPI00344279C7
MIRHGADRLFALAEAALRHPGPDEVEVTLAREQVALTRFADSRIHQNVHRLDHHVRVRVVLDGGAAGARVGSATSGLLTPEGVRRAVDRAYEIARTVPGNPDFAGLPDGGAAYASVRRDDLDTAGCPPARRADLVAAVLRSLPGGVNGAGALETGANELAVLNSRGVRAYHAGTRAALSVLATAADSTGYAEGVAVGLDGIDPVTLGSRAGEKARLGARPRELAPGSYPVVLEPGATAVLLHRLAHAFAGRAVREGSSPLADRLGRPICAPSVTLVDDPLSPALPAAPFDAEGVPRRRTSLVDRGVAAGLTYDSAAARLSGVASTGHALAPPNPLSGLPTHLVMAAGSETTESLVGRIDRGIYVTRFHYTNVVHPVRTTVTGTTRDGTFLIENGKLVGGVRNLRFTQSVLAALSGVEAIGREGHVTSERFYGDAYAPPLCLSSFTFTSASTH